MNLFYGFLVVYFGFNLLLIVGIAANEIRQGAFCEEIKWLEVLKNLIVLFLWGLPMAITHTVSR